MEQQPQAPSLPCGTMDLLRRAHFCAVRQLVCPGASREEQERLYGPAARLHGHEFLVEVTLRGSVHDVTGMVINFDEVRPHLLGPVLAGLKETRLDTDLPGLGGRPATLEHLARYIREGLEPACAARSLHLARVRLYLNDRTWVDDPGGPVMELTRRYHFAASHRLAAAQLDEEENRRIYGKCANPRGHGHNYTLAVTVAGMPDARTGLVVSGSHLDALVQGEVLQRLDHSFLGLDQPELFGERVVTAETLAQVVWEQLADGVAGLGVQLACVRVEETRDSAVEYRGDAGAEEGVTPCGS